MSELIEARQWSPGQITAQHFLAACKTDSDGNVWTEGEFCTEVLHIHPITLSKWKQLPGWNQAVAEKIPEKILRWLPKVDSAQYLQALKGDTNAAKYLRSVAGMPVADRSETTLRIGSIDAVTALD